MDSKLQHRHNDNDEWHTVRTDEERTADPALELARWLEVRDAIDETASGAASSVRPSR